MSNALNVSSAMTSAINRVYSNLSLTEFTIDVTLTSATDNKYTFNPLFLDAIQIVQESSNSLDDTLPAYANELTMSFNVSPTEYMSIFDHAKDLIVLMTIVYVDTQVGAKVYNPKPITRKYKAIVKDLQNLYTKYTTGSLQPTKAMGIREQHVATRIPITLQLIEYKAYTLRQQQFHGMFENSTVGAVISYVVKTFGIGTLYMVPPDNTHVWSNIVIPAAMNFDEVFDYLQEKYGVYMKGLEFYYSDDTLYIYPPYENKPVFPYLANIYNAASGSNSGSNGYHSITGTTLDIVSTTKAQTRDIAVTSAENQGSSTGFLRASQVIDGFIGTTPKKSAIIKNNSLVISNKKQTTMSNNANNIKFKKATDNIFKESSELSRWNATMIRCGWLMAVPFLLQPGHAIKYAFDNNNIFTSKTGILESIVYNIAQKSRMNLGPLYSCRADMRLRVTSDQDS